MTPPVVSGIWRLRINIWLGVSQCHMLRTLIAYFLTSYWGSSSSENITFKRKLFISYRMHKTQNRMTWDQHVKALHWLNRHEAMMMWYERRRSFVSFAHLCSRCVSITFLSENVWRLRRFGLVWFCGGTKSASRQATSRGGSAGEIITFGDRKSVEGRAGPLLQVPQVSPAARLNWLIASRVIDPRPASHWQPRRPLLLCGWSSIFTTRWPRRQFYFRTQLDSSSPAVRGAERHWLEYSSLVKFSAPVYVLI